MYLISAAALPLIRFFEGSGGGLSPRVFAHLSDLLFSLKNSIISYLYARSRAANHYFGGTTLLITSALIFAVLFAADLITKATICPAVVEAGGIMEFIPGLIRFEYTRNTGMAWGMLSNATLILTIISLVTCFALGIFIFKMQKKMPTAIRLALLLILAGAAGNLYDRIFLGYVRDFIAFDFMNFPIFNFADSCVTIGGILLVVSLIFTRSGREFYKNFEKLFEGKPKEKADKTSVENGKGE